MELSQQEKRWTTSQMMEIPWYHPHIDRQVAEIMIRDNGFYGSYLLRDGSTHGDFVITVRGQRTVSHFEVSYMPATKTYKFGSKQFPSLDEFVNHFADTPFLKSNTEIRYVMQTPYPRASGEECFSEVGEHISKQHTDMGPGEIETPLVVVSREGYLKKRGKFMKSVKLRWFVLLNSTLSYYEKETSRQPKNTLDMTACEYVKLCELEPLRKHGYGIETKIGDRVMYMFAKSKAEQALWLKSLQTAMDGCN
eukprot:m.39992 g.39992  ORF g.39992 m.39992 type:complete len:251 (-) comp6901_c0_seq1:215-967(-)